MSLKKLKRISFRDNVLKRDNYKCKVCGRSDVKLDAHHIYDRNCMINGGFVIENGITLCDTENGCHIKAEKYHISNGLEFVDGFHPNDLYKLINSSYELAWTKSNKLL